MLSSLVVGVTGLVVLLTPGVDASLAGFALAFASNLTHEVRTYSRISSCPQIQPSRSCLWYVRCERLQ
jgi:hypothetical protein